MRPGYPPSPAGSRCCARDEGRPFGVALRGEAPNHHMLRWLKTVVVSDGEKAPVGCHVGTRKMSEPEPLLTCRDVQTRHRNRGHAPGCGSRTWRVPDDWPGGARHSGGMSLVCGARMEHGKARGRVGSALADRPVVAGKPPEWGGGGGAGALGVGLAGD